MKKNNLLTPLDIYSWYNTRHLQVNSTNSNNLEFKFYKNNRLFPEKETTDVKQQTPISSIEIPKIEYLKRILKLYSQIANKIVSDFRKTLIHDDKQYQQIVNSIESYLDNKIRVLEDGAFQVNINGKYICDGSEESYISLFKNGKKRFRQVFLEITKELLKIISSKENSVKENGKSYLVDTQFNKVNIKNEYSDKVIAIDLDGTILQSFENQIPHPQSKQALETIKNAGYKIIIYTARFSAIPESEYQSLLIHINELLNKYEIPFDEISITKPICKYYIDDQAISFKNNWNDILSVLKISESENSIFSLKYPI